ncbi:MAG: hypothetical protein ACRDAU_05465 [Clostridium sp.]
MNIKKILVVSVLAIIISIGISFIGKINMNDVLFMEGIVLVVVGLLSSMGGNTNGAGIQGLGSNSTQYITNASLEIKRMEEKNGKNKSRVDFDNINIALIFAGILCIIINFCI